MVWYLRVVRLEVGDVVRLGILTGGGDCPGLNAVLRAVVRTAENVYGQT